MPNVSIQTILQNNLPRGYTGSRGDTGFVGSAGDQGYTGSLGYTGSIGYTGSAGPQGVSIRILGVLEFIADLPSDGTSDGSTPLVSGDSFIVEEDGNLYSWNGLDWVNGGRIQGYTGSVGFVGSQGDIGYTGSQGDIGYTGSIGDTGYTGSQGDLGYTGSTGGFAAVQGLTSVDSLTYTFQSTDAGRIVEFIANGNVTATIPNDSSSNFLLGQRIDISQSGLGTLDIAAEVGVTIYSTGNNYLADQYQTGSLVKLGANEWLFVGPQSVGYTGSQGYTGSIGFTGSLGFTGSEGGLASIQDINEQTGISYVLQTSDAGKLVQLTNSSDINLTIPNDGALGAEIGQRIDLTQGGTGAVYFQLGTGVQLRYANADYLNEQYASGTLIKLDDNEWLFVGPQATGYTGSSGFTGSAGFAGSRGYTGSEGTLASIQDINAQTGTSYTFAGSDAGKLVTFTNEDEVTVTVPADSSVTFDIGRRIDIQQGGNGQVTLNPENGVVVYSTTGLYINQIYSAGTLIKVAANEWSFISPSAAGYTGSQGIPGEAAAIGYTGSVGDFGYTGSRGLIGYTGSQGDIGTGVPDGGTTGQILSKVSDDDYDTAWSDPSSELDLSAVAQDIIPSANVTYDIGSTSLRFRDIYLANSTIHLGSQQISADGSGLNLPSSVSIGNVTLDTSSGNLSLPAGSRIDGVAVATPRISSIDYPDDNTAADTAGGQTLGIVGSGFVSGASVILDGTSLGTVTVVSSTRIEITAPAKSAGSYTLYVINSDGGTGIFVPGVQYSGLPTWSSPAAGSLGTVYETANVTATFSATSDSSVTYSLLSGDLPAGTSLDSSTGVLSGTADLIIGSSVTYSFTIRATDAENQDTDRAFSLTIDADSVTWSSPTDGDTISVPVDTASTTTLSAASAAGDSITYSANTLPSGLTLSGDTITGTANTVANTSVALTATADTTARSATVIVTFSVIQISDYIATPTATPAAFGDALEGGFYTGLIWNQVTQSDTSTTIATGSKTFTVTDDMAATPLFYGGQEVEVRSRANPDTARMIGTVTNAQGTTLTVNVTSVDGSGTLTDWSIMAKYRIIVSPKSSGENDYKPYKSSSTAAPAACGTLTEGLKATLAMVAAGSSAVYPAAHFCNDLSIGGYSDWYLPARDELELIWRNLKPVTDNNVTTANRLTGATPDYKNLGSLGDVANTHGLNNNSYPQGAAYTAAVPGQTSAVAFQTGGAEAMAFGSGRYYRSSTEYSDSNAWIHFYRSGSTAGSQIATIKTPEYYVRAVRRSII
jgi:hypothetical protein